MISVNTYSAYLRTITWKATTTTNLKGGTCQPKMRNAVQRPFVSVRVGGQLDRMLESGRTGVMTGDSAESSEPVRSSVSRVD